MNFYGIRRRVLSKTFQSFKGLKSSTEAGGSAQSGISSNDLHLFTQFNWYSLVDCLLPFSLFAFLLPVHVEFWMLLILVCWLVIKMSLRAFRDRTYLYVLAVFFISISTFFRPMAVSSLSDLLLVLFAFVVGAGCSRKRWMWSLWILASMGVVAIVALNVIYEPGGVRFFSTDSVSWFLPSFRIMIGKIHVNLSGYLLGSVSLVGYGIWRHNRFKARWLAFGFAVIAYSLTFLTGSKASAFLPIVSILFAELAWKYRKMIQGKAMLLAMAFLGIGLMFSLMLYLPNGPLSKISTNESARSQVAQCFFREATYSWPRFFRGNGGDAVSEYCEDRVVVISRKGRSLSGLVPHAHNSYLQIFADYGVFPVILLLIVFVFSIRNALNLAASGDGLLGTMGFSLGLFLFFFGLFDSTLLSWSINQVMTGYLLAVSWPERILTQ